MRRENYHASGVNAGGFINYTSMLREYQDRISTEAAALLQQYRICYLAMEVRTGKTMTALATADKYGARDVLFVTKKKAITSIAKDADVLKCSYVLTVINYEQLHNVNGTFDIVILDEAHSLGQFPTLAERTKLLIKLCAGLPIIYLSGTPTPESYSQIYHQLRISSFSPFSSFPTFYKWAKEFVNIKEKFIFNRKINDYSGAIKEKIDEYTKHLFISYTQQQAGFTAMIQEKILPVEMKPQTTWLANELQKKLVYVGKGGEKVLADTAVKLMGKLQQIYSGTVIPEEGSPIAFDDSKAQYIKEHFAGQKIAVFYKFRTEYILLVSVFGADKITESPEEFNERSDLVFVSQIQSGREGINLSTADALIMYNIDFSSVSYQQTRARIQTKDRTKEAKLYWLFANGGIEGKIYQAVIDKQDYTLSYFKRDYPTAIKSGQIC